MRSDLLKARALSRQRGNLRENQNYSEENFWARGDFVLTVGLDEQAVRAYIKEQEKEEARYEQLSLWK